MPTDIRRGFVTQLGMDPLEALDDARDAGFDHVELMMDGETHPDALAADADAIRERADDHGLDLAVHLPFALDIGSPFAHVREGSVRELAAALDTAADLGAEVAVAHAASNAWSAAWDDGTVQDHILDSVRTLDGHARDRDVRLCVENVPDGFFPVQEFPRLFAETDAAMTLDTGHARMDGMESEDMAAFLDDHRDRVAHLHLNDTRVAEDGHVPFGSGTLDFDTILDPLRNDWRGTLSLEVFTYDRNYIAYSLERLDDLL